MKNFIYKNFLLLIFFKSVSYLDYLSSYDLNDQEEYNKLLKKIEVERRLPKINYRNEYLFLDQIHVLRVDYCKLKFKTDCPSNTQLNTFLKTIYIQAYDENDKLFSEERIYYDSGMNSFLDYYYNNVKFDTDLFIRFPEGYNPKSNFKIKLEFEFTIFSRISFNIRPFKSYNVVLDIDKREIILESDDEEELF